MIKQKLIALACALALCLSMAACTISTPATVGTIGDVEITSGIYLLSQFQAYQTVLGYADSEQSALSAAKFLKETVYVPDETAEDATTDDTATDDTADTDAEETPDGTPRLVSELIAEETAKNLNFYAAIEVKFAQLGGTLTEEAIVGAKSYAKQLWDANSTLYSANGIGLASLEAYQLVGAKNTALLDLVYGAEGVEAVSDADLTAFLESDMAYIGFVNVPTYNMTAYSFADEDETKEMVSALEAGVSDYAKEATATDAQGASTEFITSMAPHVVDAYAVIGTEYNPTQLSSDLYIQLVGKENLTSNFGTEHAQSILDLDYNEATSFNTNQMSIMSLLRLDPLSDATLDDLRHDILVEMKFYDLVDLLDEEGSALPHALDESAMRKFPASKLKNADA